jgi:N-methylhydantoinase B
MSVTEKPTTEVPDFVRDHYDVDHVTLDIIENTLSNTRYEMDRVLETTAVSPVIREQSDQFPLMADRKARMVMGQFGCAIKTIIDHSPYEVEDLRDGDVIAMNDPYLCEGSVSHTPDFMLVRPVFFEGDLVGYTSQWGNLIDVGGTAAGSMPISARSIYHEGIRMPPIKLYDQGKLNEEALRMFCHNTRVPAFVEADIKAIAAGTAAGAARIIELCERFGKDTYLEACDAILNRTRSAVIELIRTHLPDGERFSFEDLADDDGLGTGPIKLRMTMWRDGDTLNVDWEGSDPQVPGSVNFYLNPEMFKMFCGVFLIMAFAPDVAFNDGYNDIINVNLPEGSVLRPRFPAPLGNRLTLMARHFDVVGAVFSKALSKFEPQLPLLGRRLAGRALPDPRDPLRRDPGQARRRRPGRPFMVAAVQGRPHRVPGEVLPPARRRIPDAQGLGRRGLSPRRTRRGEDLHVPRGRPDQLPGRSRAHLPVGRGGRALRRQLLQAALACRRDGPGSPLQGREPAGAAR